MNGIRFGCHHKGCNPKCQNSQKETKEWWEQYWERGYINSGKANEDSISAMVGWTRLPIVPLSDGLQRAEAFPSMPAVDFFIRSIASDSINPLSADYRSEDETGFAAQQQLLTYWPLLKSGDVDLLNTQLDFYLKNLENATIGPKPTGITMELTSLNRWRYLVFP